MRGHRGLQKAVPQQLGKGLEQQNFPPPGCDLGINNPESRERSSPGTC